MILVDTNIIAHFYLLTEHKFLTESVPAKVDTWIMRMLLASYASTGSDVLLGDNPSHKLLGREGSALPWDMLLNARQQWDYRNPYTTRKSPDGYAAKLPQFPASPEHGDQYRLG